jgi:hypothetical protein
VPSYTSPPPPPCPPPQRLLLCALRDFPAYTISDADYDLAEPIRLLVTLFPAKGTGAAAAAGGGLGPGMHTGAWLSAVLSDPSLHKHMGSTPAAVAQWSAGVNNAAQTVLDPVAAPAAVTDALHSLADLVQGYRSASAGGGEGEDGGPQTPKAQEDGEVVPTSSPVQY